MQEIYSSDFEDSLSLGEIPISNSSNALKVSLSHWLGGTLDMDLEVSYDGGANWIYGGGCKGAVSAEGGVAFHLTYQKEPTHIRGSLFSDQKSISTVKIFSGD